MTEGPARTRAEARARGDRFYLTGKPCPRGHVTMRRVSTRTCLLCEEFWRREQRILDPETHEFNAETRRIIRSERYANDPEYRAREDERTRKNARKRYANDPEYRQRILASVSTPEFRAKLNARRRERYANDPDYRQRILASDRRRARKIDQ